MFCNWCQTLNRLRPSLLIEYIFKVVFGLNVPNSVCFAVDLTSAVAGIIGIFFAGNAAVDYFRQPFSYANSFSTTWSADSLRIEKPNTKDNGYFDSFFCVRQSNGIYTAQVAGGMFSERAEVFNLNSNQDFPFPRRGEIYVYTHVYAETSGAPITIAEVYDVRTRTRVARSPISNIVHCDEIMEVMNEI